MASATRDEDVASECRRGHEHGLILFRDQRGVGFDPEPAAEFGSGLKG